VEVSPCIEHSNGTVRKAVPTVSGGPSISMHSRQSRSRRCNVSRSRRASGRGLRGTRVRGGRTQSGSQAPGGVSARRCPELYVGDPDALPMPAAPRVLAEPRRGPADYLDAQSSLGTFGSVPRTNIEW